MEFAEFSIETKNLSDFETEVIIAELSDSGCQGFLEEEEFLKVYIPLPDAGKIIEGLADLIRKRLNKPLNYRYSIICEKNWNREWELNYSSVLIDGRVLIRAPFHEISDAEFVVTIEPKMSFGTGHHETTRLMIRSMLNENFHDRKVLDMGCGSGILGILAKKMGAQYIMAVDNDEWAYRNCIDNFLLNDVSQPYNVILGDWENIEYGAFDFILANINRNVLIHDLPVYSRLLVDNGILIISGILVDDKEILLETASLNGLKCVQISDVNNWISIKFRK